MVAVASSEQEVTSSTNPSSSSSTSGSPTIVIDSVKKRRYYVSTNQRFFFLTAIYLAFILAFLIFILQIISTNYSGVEILSLGGDAISVSSGNCRHYYLDENGHRQPVSPIDPEKLYNYISYRQCYADDIILGVWTGMIYFFLAGTWLAVLVENKNTDSASSDDSITARNNVLRNGYLTQQRLHILALVNFINIPVSCYAIDVIAKSCTTIGPMETFQAVIHTLIAIQYIISFLVHCYIFGASEKVIRKTENITIVSSQRDDNDDNHHVESALSTTRDSNQLEQDENKNPPRYNELYP